MTYDTFTITALGDSAAIVSFGNEINESINNKILSLLPQLKGIPYVTDIYPAYSSLTIYYNTILIKQKSKNNKSAFDIVTDQIKKITETHLHVSYVPPRKIKIPVCYAPKYALDINDIAKEKKLSIEEIIMLHTANKYKVYMIGFLPGFAYMGETDKKIEMPRKAQPRITVEAGSVGIAGLQTGIYPLDSPGGWQIIGKTPITLFNKENKVPVLLQPGDEIEFYSITEDEFANY